MGNKIARTTQVSATEYYLHDLPSSYNLVLIEVLGRGRFFKSILCKHDEGLVLVKVYFKRGDPLDLKEYERRLSEIRNIFQTVQHPHVWPFQFWLETDKAAYLLRQHFFSNLHDRLSTRPFLSLIEKKWLAYQLLCAVKQSHDKEVCHGDIKCENVLVSSWNWLYLADFASFKPTYIPDDDPSDFSFFFDTGGRRRCYLAPERFYDHVGEANNAPDSTLKKSMDIFSVGCVVAELFLEGQPLFELSQLLAYRRGQYDPSLYLEKIPDVGIREMILHMIQLDPEGRLSCDNYLQSYASAVFPSYFSPFLHKLFSCLIPLDSDTRVAMTKGAFSEISRQMMNDRAIDDIVSETSMDTNLIDNESLQNCESGRENTNFRDDGADPVKSMVGKGLQLVDDIASIYREVEKSNAFSHATTTIGNIPNVSTNSSSTNHTLFSNKAKHIGRQTLIYAHGYKENEVPLFKKFHKNDLESLMAKYSIQTESNEMPFFQVMECKTTCEGMVLIASLLCSCIRSVKQPQLRRAGVLMLRSCSFYIDDEDRLQHVLPYVIAMLSDPAAIVRCAALDTLCDVLALVRDFPPSDAKIFPEYILPMLSMLPDDPEQSVRICYASNIFKIALAAYRFLICSKSLTGAGSFDKVVPTKSQLLAAEPLIEKQTDNSDVQLAQLRKSIAEVVQELVMGSKQTPNIRRALLQDIGHLCYFFGQRQCNDFLLPILPAFLNDRDEQLRAVFYGQIVFVCYFVGRRSVEEYLLPYIEQALTDGMEAVIVNALDCLSMLCRSGFLRKRILLDMIERSFPLLCYPSQWVRRAVATFIAASSQTLGPVDSYVYLYPILRPFLQREPPSLYSESSLLSCLKPPVSKSVFYQVLEKTRNTDMLERQRKIWYNSSALSNNWETLENINCVAADLDPMKKTWNKESMAPNVKFSGNSVQKVTSSDVEDAAKLRKGNSFIDNGAMDEMDSFSSDKMHFSGFFSPHNNTNNSFLFDGPSEGIPIYSYMDKHKMGMSSKVSDSSVRWNSVGIASSCMPWVGSANKPTSLSNSVPPRLISGSFFNNTNSNVVYDPYSHEIDPSFNITSKLKDVTISEIVKNSSSSFGDDKHQSDVTMLPSFSRTSTIPDAGWKPRGVLVAHLQEHSSSVNDIAVSNDNSFFVSASSDSTVKIWDTRKLEKDISFRSRLTYSLGHSQALCVSMLRGTAQVIVGASNGTLHLFAVDYVSRGMGNVVERYSGIADSRKREAGEGAVLTLLNCSSSDGGVCHTVLYSTRDCGINLWDTRTNSAGWTFRVTPEEGFISSLVMGQCGNWFVSGSSRGVLTLWDLRFLLPVNSWQYSTVCPVERMCLLIPSSNSVPSMARPLIYVSAGCNEVSLWNAETGSCHQVFRVASYDSVAEMSSIPRALARPSNKPNSKQDMKRNSSSKYRIDELNEPPPRLPGIRSLLPLPGGDLLTGGTDLKIRYWNHTSPERSYAICGPSTKGLGNDEHYETRSCFGVQIVQEMSRRAASSKQTQKALLAVAATDSAGCHRDSVLSLASVKLNQRLLISSSRDGALKVWK
ncbi:serine/threonine-protein kinase VPS15 isoform X1 [Dendrobium catenatum]|uniref:non-specific serine/threonine protein kinase n=1 Tax=Dendrobium catenatum TaxID=906689 RepID=A0A2I0VMB5_9ASPA|nr:serine/threonine-protein kinase VPS15 isoform X1 [Dendrobium catenatum]PKU64555.1 putative serine/threonine-protein kinase CCRP1 [Dendrobium catenatum]